MMGLIVEVLALLNVRTINRQEQLAAVGREPAKPPVAYMAALGIGILVVAVILAVRAAHVARTGGGLGVVALLIATVLTTGFVSVVILLAAWTAVRRSND